MKKEITLGQVLVAFLGLITTIVTGWITMSNKVTDVQRRVQTLESQRITDNIEYRKSIDELKWQIQDGNKRITDILVELQNKQNRK